MCPKLVAAGLAGAALAAPLLGRTLQRAVGMALTAGSAPLLAAAFAIASGGGGAQGSAAAPAAQADAWEPKVRTGHYTDTLARSSMMRVLHTACGSNCDKPAGRHACSAKSLLPRSAGPDGGSGGAAGRCTGAAHAGGLQDTGGVGQQGLCRRLRGGGPRARHYRAAVLGNALLSGGHRLGPHDDGNACAAMVLAVCTLY